MGGWEPGTSVVVREVWKDRVWTAYPAVVVEETPGQYLFFIPHGTDLKYAVDDQGRELRLYADQWALAQHRTSRAMLCFCWPDRRHSILAFWDGDGNFTGWYVNVETPMGRSPTSYDYVDHCIDVLIPPDRSTWTWKDEDELEEAVRRGIWSGEEAASFRAEAREGARRVMVGEPPFDRDWSTWRPDPAWPIPALPEGWDVVR